MNLLDAGYSLLEEYQKMGFRAFFVGGVVRNLILQKPIADIDICTDAYPEVSMGHYEKVIPTGLPFGSVTVIWKGYSFEVTTFRKESTYTDGRRPKNITFVDDLEMDLQRRDFTINAIAMDREGSIIDPLGGLADIQQQVIRAVGKPSERFQEDGLRLLRAIRFAAQLNFKIEANTWDQLCQHRHVLQNVARERILDELEKILKSPNKIIGLLLLDQAELIFKLTIHPQPLSKLALSNDLDVLWSFLFLYTSPVKNLDFKLDSLPFSKKRKQLITQLIAWIETHRYAPYLELIRLAKDFPIQWIVKFAELQSILNGDVFMNQKEVLEDAWNRLPVKRITDLTIRGNDLINLYNRSAGPWLKETLSHLWDQVNFNGLSNNYQAIVDYLQQNKCLFINGQPL